MQLKITSDLVIKDTNNGSSKIHIFLTVFFETGKTQGCKCTLYHYNTEDYGSYF